MLPFRIEQGIAAPFPEPNVNTDVIMPKRFLKTVTRDDLALGVFADLRFAKDGGNQPSFILNRPIYQHARFLVVGDNFGCGSSREHAVWGLMQLGIRALIGTTFAGIFFDNCRRNGLLAITCPSQMRDTLLEQVSDSGRAHLKIDLEDQTIRTEDGKARPFDIEPARKADLLLGRDAIAQTLEDAAAISAFEMQRRTAALAQFYRALTIRE